LAKANCLRVKVQGDIQKGSIDGKEPIHTSRQSPVPHNSCGKTRRLPGGVRAVVPQQAEVGASLKRLQNEAHDEGDSTTGEPERKIGFELHATDASLNSLKLLNRYQWWFA